MNNQTVKQPETESKGHTPGPWAVTSGPDLGIWIEVPNWSIANVIPHPEAHANAHLIAAAPDLLAVLKELLEAVRTQPALNHMRYDTLGVKVNAAIAKAEGR